jgi:hypothetical protein
MGSAEMGIGEMGKWGNGVLGVGGWVMGDGENK